MAGLGDFSRFSSVISGITSGTFTSSSCKVAEETSVSTLGTSTELDLNVIWKQEFESEETKVAVLGVIVSSNLSPGSVSCCFRTVEGTDTGVTFTVSLDTGHLVGINI